MANTPVVMPKMSMTMTEGEVVEILVSVGDEVTAGQVIAVVGTDKTDMEVESDHAGKVLEVPAKHGDVLEVGAPLIVLETKSEDLLAGLFGSDKPEGETEQAETPAADASPEIKQEQAQEPQSQQLLAMPGARKLARESGVDLSKVSASSATGVIKQADVLISGDKAPKPEASTVAVRDSDKARALTAKIVETSLQIPQFTLTKEIELNGRLPEDFVARAAKLIGAWEKTLLLMPKINAGFVNGDFVQHSEIRVAYLLEAETGFVSPVVALEQDWRSGLGDVLAAAKTNRIGIKNLSGSTTSITDLGEFDVLQANTLLFGGQSSGLSFGKFTEGASISTIAVTIVLDHRIADPGDGARALSQFQKYLSEDLDV